MGVFKKVRNICIGWFGGLLITVLGMTLRYRIRDRSGLMRPGADAAPVIFAFWHNELMVMPYFYPRFMKGRRVVCLVSASQDGEMLVRVMEWFGLRAARGSSSRKGREAYRTLAEHLRGGWDVAITPDGPRGPRHQAQLGVIGLAALSGRPLIPVICRPRWKIELPTWDRFVIPIPFTRCDYFLEAPFYVAEGAPTEESLRKLERMLEEANGSGEGAPQHESERV